MLLQIEFYSIYYNMKTKKITYAAACAALGAVAVLLSTYTPTKVVPLIFYSAAVYVSLNFVGWWGLISAAAGLIIAFFAAGGFTGTFVLALTVFTPYAFFAFAVRKLSYFKPQTAIIRGALAVVYFLIEAFVLLLLIKYLGEVNFVIVMDNIGVWALFLVFALAAVPTDFFFLYATVTLLRAINKRLGTDSGDKPNGPGKKNRGGNDDDKNDPDDIFK